MSLLQVKDINKKVSGEISISRINFEQKANEKIAIAGISGAGKTTLLKMIAGLVQPDSGEILLEGKRVSGPDDKLLPGHPEIGYMSQHYELRNNYRVEELIWFENKLPETKANELFEICAIRHLLHRRTNQLSGGEKQRITLCMLLVKSPKLLIMDEPFSNLDPIHTHTLKKVLDDMTAHLKISCLLTSHDPNDTLSWADRILLLRNGKIIQEGTPEDIYHHPIDEYVAAMFGHYNLISVENGSIFPSIINVPGNNKKLIIRPEEFSISASPNNGQKGIVKKIFFMGTHYLIFVSIGDADIMVNGYDTLFHQGQEVFISLKTRYHKAESAFYKQNGKTFFKDDIEKK